MGQLLQVMADKLTVDIGDARSAALDPADGMQAPSMPATETT
jgi:hypothetical protein